MANNYSPYTGSTPGEEYYYARDRYQSATPTPSPRGHSYYPPGSGTPQRPATRAHFRSASGGYDYHPRPPTASPRYTSDGYYATANVSSGHHSRKTSWTTPSRPKRERRSSYVYVRSSTPYGDSDEDEVIEVDGRTYVIPAKSRETGGRNLFRDYHYEAARGHATDYHYYSQGGYSFHDRDAVYEQRPRHTANTHARRSSTNVPPRSATARPSTPQKKAPPPPGPVATEADAKAHRIPPGYSLKNWDPTEEPILLLGSVFDANSLGKWIYDWTVYHHKPTAPISDVAGDLWLLLIRFAGIMKTVYEIVDRVRAVEKKALVEEFVDGGDRLREKLFKLLKTCEAPMLQAASKKGGRLGKNAGIEFVETIFGPDREMDRTEKFMSHLRLFIQRYEINCEAIVNAPTR